MLKFVPALLLSGLLLATQADVVVFENGDRLTGKVLSLTESDLKLRNDVQGVITLPRQTIVSIHFRDGITGPVPALPNASAALEAVPSPDDTTQAIDQVQNQLLAGATPEAQQMYREMVQGFLSGQISVEAIQQQARQALTELRSLEAELGDDETTALLSSYAAILENFLKESPPTTNSSRRVVPPSPARVPGPTQE